jgi:D-alanyl-D-alanine-carboxypeptidase/D-alanyl-D-alanine-endopeptidase
MRQSREGDPRMISAHIRLLRICLSSLIALLPAVYAHAAGIDGTWDGTLDLGIQGETRISVEAKNGSASIASPDQTWSPVKGTIAEAGGRTTLNAASIGVTFRGEPSQDGTALTGSWAQGGRLRPLVLHRRATDGLPAWPNLAPARIRAHTPSDAEIKAILSKRVLLEHQGVGIVVGVIDSRGRRIVAFGRSDASDPRPLDGNTVFEIGSISKIFTSLLLEDGVIRGEVALSDPASRFAPKGAVLPESGGRQIALVDLSTHTSGLPGDDDDFWGKNPDFPSAHYDVAHLFRFVGRVKLSHTPGTSFGYSNIGGSVLGQLLAQQAGKSYGQLVRDRIAIPLGMNATTVAPPAGTPVAVGHNAALKPVPPFNAQAYDPAGGLRSTANDMLTFLGAELGYVKTPLARALRAQWSTVRRPAINPRVQVALGWIVTLRPEGEIIWHNGSTTGFRSFTGFNPKTGVGVVVLSNTLMARLGPDDIGLHLLDPATPLDVAAPATK